MRRLQSILYVTTGTNDDSGALEQAVRLAHSHEAALHALIVSPALPRRFSDYAAAYEASLAERVETSIQKATSALRLGRGDVHVAVEVDYGDPSAEPIVRRVLRHAHDFVVKQPESVGGRAGFRALDLQLLRLCPCPVWLCRPIPRPARDIRVAVAIDPQSTVPAGRDLALQLLRLARSWADTFSGELTIISCWDFPFEGYLRESQRVSVPDHAIDAAVTTAERRHRAALEGIVRESAISGAVQTHHARGPADRTIARLVHGLAVDILVMGTVGRTGLRAFVVGNTAENVLSEIQCSLVALKPNGFASPLRAYG